MVVETITYKDFNGIERTEDFYFHISEAELLELDQKYPEGFGKHLDGIVKSNDGAKVFAAFKDILALSYGVKSEDGRRFIKSPEISKEFMETNAYGALVMSLAADEKKVAAFMEGLFPADLIAQAKAANAGAASKA